MHLNLSRHKSYISSPNYGLSEYYSTDTSLCLELKQRGRGVELSRAVTGLWFKERSHTSTPLYTPSWPVELILHFVTLSRLSVTIHIVLYDTICVTATVSL